MPQRARNVTHLRTGLVLGAGGTVGVAYHAGVLRALQQVAGFEPDDADLVVGTSAGSFAAALVRSGVAVEEFWQTILGTHPSVADLSAEEIAASRAGLFAPLFADPLAFARRAIGSAYLLGRSAVRVPLPVPPAVLQALFPAGLFTNSEGRRRFAELLPASWPQRSLWLATVDIVSGRRVVLGRPGAPATSLHDAVAASCAIPGLYNPVRVGRRTLVDGGVHSSSNLDLASRSGCSLVIGVIPMAFDTREAPPPQIQLARRLPARMLAAEVAGARAAGTQVVLFRPTATELRIHGFNLMRRSGWDQVARAAYDTAARFIETDRFQRAFGAADAA